MEDRCTRPHLPLLFHQIRRYRSSDVIVCHQDKRPELFDVTIVGMASMPSLYREEQK